MQQRFDPKGSSSGKSIAMQVHAHTKTAAKIQNWQTRRCLILRKAPWMIFYQFFLKFLSASSACTEMLILRPPGVMLFLGEALTNCRCETCLTCLSFSALRCFISCECSGFWRGVGYLFGDA